MTLFRTKPWLFKGRKMERNAPKGYRCDSTCTHGRPSPAQCLCTVCHELFSGFTAFDDHRDEGWCRNPASVGLVQRPNGMWGGPPMDPVALNRLRSREDE